MHPGSLPIADYTYHLPEDRIARYPLPERDGSKLLVYRNGAIQDDVYRNIGDYLPSDAMLVFNNTRVIPARLLFEKTPGSLIEIFCLAPCGEITAGLGAPGKSRWECLVGGIKKWKSGLLEMDLPSGRLFAELLERGPETCVIEFTWTPPEAGFAEILEQAGQVPLPPYLQRPADPEDRKRYQTVYARYDGSVAAPTAGLHFTESLLQNLQQKGITLQYVTLHVGAGTFRPVKSTYIADHTMHAEYFEVGADAIRALRGPKQAGLLVAVGTTSLRTLESLYLMGCKAARRPQAELSELLIGQWDAYSTDIHRIPALDALDAIGQWLEKKGMDRLVAPTSLLIAPGYETRMIDALVTNFHQPNSTLLLLVAALAGADWKRIYQHALDHGYRFLSYGDGSILFV